MERSSITKWLFLGLAVFLFLQIGLPWIRGEKGEEAQPLTVKEDVAPPERETEAFCSIQGERFRAELSTRGASLRHLVLTDKRYANDGVPKDLITTSREERSPLRFDLRNPLASADSQQVPYDDVDWELTA